MLGLVCHFVEQKKKKNGEIVLYNKFETKTLQLGAYKQGKYTEEQIKATYLHNVQKTLEVMPAVVSSGIRMFRLSSNLFPLYDIAPRKCWDNPEVKTALKDLGNYVVMHKMRISVHPGQFCVLSSDSDSIVAKAFEELSIHGWLFDTMGLDHSPKWSINIHGGKADRTSRLIEQIKSLPDNVRKRLTLENDETCYSVVDLLEVYQETGVPIVWDSHHSVFNSGGITEEEAQAASMETWPSGIKPLQHLANTEPGRESGSFNERRKHSNLIHYVPEHQLRSLRDDVVDVEVECKLKNIGIFKLSKDFDVPL